MVISTAGMRDKRYTIDGITLLERDIELSLVTYDAPMKSRLERVAETVFPYLKE